MFVASPDGIISKIFFSLFVSQSVNGFSRKHNNPVHHMFIDISGEIQDISLRLSSINPLICKSMKIRVILTRITITKIP